MSKNHPPKSKTAATNHTHTQFFFPCKTELIQLSGGNALLQGNSHKNDWIPSGRISASAVLEQMKDEEMEMFDVKKATARSQPASLFTFLPFLGF